MRPLIVQEFVSLDGVMQAPGDPSEYPGGGWQQPVVGEHHQRLMVTQMRDADALILGRRTYERFADDWPRRHDDYGLARRLNEMPKYVATTTLTSVAWNATVIRGDVAQALTDLKHENGRGVVVVGSRCLVSYLQAHDLVDEYRLWIHPVIVGSGERLFDAGLNPSQWHLFDVESTGEGVVVATYRRAPQR